MLAQRCGPKAQRSYRAIAYPRPPGRKVNKNLRRKGVLRRSAFAAGVDVRARAADESEKRDAEILRQVDG